MANTIIQGVNYKTVRVSSSVDTWDIIPFDFGGKALIEMTIEIHSEVDNGFLYLPEISSFNGVYGTTIKVIAPDGDENTVRVYPSGSDKIGSLLSVSLNADGENAIFTIAAEGYWAMLKTD